MRSMRSSEALPLPATAATLSIARPQGARRWRACVAVALAVALSVPVAMLCPAPRAEAITQTQIDQAQSSVYDSQQQEDLLRQQLAGVQSDLAAKLLALDDLTNVQIPAAQAKVDEANEKAAQTKSEAEAATQRLEAAQKDQENLEKQIEATGVEYDDARAAVAQTARESMHASTQNTLMSVVTNSTTTSDFIASMQSQDALSRTEANAASEAADSLSTSQNRSQRLEAIKQEVAQLKTAADEANAAAQAAAAEAQSEMDSLDQLRAQGETERAALEVESQNISDEAAAQAAQTILLQSQLDSLNRQYAAEQAAEAARVREAQQQAARQAAAQQAAAQQAAAQQAAAQQAAAQKSSSSSGTSSTPASTTVPATSTGSSGQGTSNGDYGNAYAWHQCTWWAYERRKQMGIGTPSYLGNGGQWYLNAAKYGLRADHTPQVGAAISFLPGQAGANRTYGHVGVVEAVYSDGSILISEMNGGLAGIGHVCTRTLPNASIYWYVH